ncbi:MAG: anhydro-N-acetylmuramic acid kinase [Chloroflexi bacterium]|nr:anhydro-N-acetylmuramic acid kinase [Chloroflexota bacterium]
MSDLAIGIMSGTSADGIDAALIEVDDAARVSETIAHAAVPFPDDVRARILALGSGEPVAAADVARLHARLGDMYAAAAMALMPTARRPVVIGLHGQTISHLPAERATLQIGDAARVAVLTGIPTVDDFRSADIAAGGEGAPLTPFADHILFAGRGPRVVVNIGGIANVTLLPDAEAEHVTGFDTGPGNMVVDAIARMSGQRYDVDGAGARRGRVVERALDEALAHPFFARPAPKSAGREEFGAEFTARLVERVRSESGALDDALATATELTARTVAAAVRARTSGGTTWREVLVAGGGAANSALVERLAAAFGPVSVRRVDDLGVPSEAREAIAFAILAVYRLRELPNTLPAVTGARGAVCAGALHRP